jgi:hypothetical protein
MTAAYSKLSRHALALSAGRIEPFARRPKARPVNTNRLAASLIAASLLAPESPARAMTLQTVEMTCPYDGTSFQFIAQGSRHVRGPVARFHAAGSDR